MCKKKKKNNVTSSLSPIQRSGHSAQNCKMVFWVFHPSGSEEYHPQKLRIFRKRSQNWQNDFENVDLSNLTLSLQTFDKKLRPHLLKEANSKELEKESIHMYLTPIGTWINVLWNRFNNNVWGNNFIHSAHKIQKIFKNYSIPYS